MITHGGPGSVRECVLAGVPMVLCPIAFDQRGTAARAVFHGLGVRADVDRLEPESLRAMIRRVLEDPAYRMQTRLTQESLRRTERTQSAARVIHGMRADPGRLGAPSPRVRRDHGDVDPRRHPGRAVHAQRVAA